MGNSAHPLLVSLKDTIQGNDQEEMGKKPSNGNLCDEVLEAQAKRRSSQVMIKKRRANLKNGGHLRSKRTRRILMKRRVAGLEGINRRGRNGIERRVRTLKKLVPNAESMGLDVLFRETADYITSLQMRVRVMQIMVNVLTGSDG